MTISDDFFSPALRDCFVVAQKHYERELTGWLVSHPIDVLQLCGEWTPEVCFVEKKFWLSVKQLNLDCPEEDQIRQAHELAKNLKVFPEYMKWVCSVDSYTPYLDRIRYLLTVIKLLHDGRVAIEVIQDHPSILQGVFYGW
jgi:hypothetical protein